MCKCPLLHLYVASWTCLEGRGNVTHTWSPGGGGDPRGACPGSPVCGAFISPPAWRPSSTITQVDPAAAGGLETRLHASGLRSSSLGALFPPSSPLLFISPRRSDGSSERPVCDVSQTRLGPNILFTNPQHSADRNNGELMRGKVWNSLQFVGVTAKVAAFSVTLLRCLLKVEPITAPRSRLRAACGSILPYHSMYIPDVSSLQQVKQPTLDDECKTKNRPWPHPLTIWGCGQLTP